MKSFHQQGTKNLFANGYTQGGRKKNKASSHSSQNLSFVGSETGPWTFYSIGFFRWVSWKDEQTPMGVAKFTLFLHCCPEVPLEFLRLRWQLVRFRVSPVGLEDEPQTPPGWLAESKRSYNRWDLLINQNKSVTSHEVRYPSLCYFWWVL